MINAARKDVWLFNYDQKLTIEVQHWGVDREDPSFEPLNYGQGCWNYYIYVHENKIGTEIFERTFWLENMPVKFLESSPARITHEYMQADFNQVDWHGGVTFYEKYGHTIGHRAVKIGCDFDHLWDEERGYNYTFQEVAEEATQTAIQLWTLITSQTKPSA